MSITRALPCLLLLPVALAACRGREAAATPPGSSLASASPASHASPSSTVSGTGVVAEVNGAPILAGDLDQKAAGRLARLRQEEYEIRSQTLDEMISDRVIDAEAARRRLTRDELLKREVNGKAEAPSSASVEALYETNKARFGSQPKDKAIARIREVLGQRAVAERRAAYVKQLRDKARVAVRLEAPRVDVPIPDGAPFTGPAAAPVSIVEFTDYQCPFCHRSQGVIEQVLARYQGKVRLVHLDFPLEGHTGAMPAARAARCAGEQGKFWEYHRNLMTVSGTLDDSDLKARAASLGLRAPEFGSCLASARHDSAIQASLAEGESLGVTGTPAYFINGRMLSGARPLEDFTEVVDTELAGR